MKKDNNYELYRQVKTSKDYFDTWDTVTSSQLDDSLKAKIYERYVLKCFVFQRDGFKCINEGCDNPINPDNPLTMHHIKFQKNNGKDSPKNCATICKLCHRGFHRAKIALTFHGATYKVHKDDEINWKIIKKKNKQFRKHLFRDEQLSISISYSLLEQLIKFLMTSYDEDMNDDD
jgi:hypothetical protein